MQPYLQVSLNVRGRTCVVVGGGPEAEERVVRLIEAQARVVVVAEALTEPLARWASQGRIEHRARGFEGTDLEGAFLVLVVGRDAAWQDRIFEQAQARGVLVYAQDRPESSHLAMPALVRRGLLRMAISTDEASPALAGQLRGQLERLFDEPFVRYILWLDELRTQLKDSEPDPERRAERLRAAVEGFSIHGLIHYPEAYRNRSTST
ncbi:MAG TPA: bifunctional precorrin-2 dehydrogenase/sirohydrochlorin ferrochelatase [Polyangia bacterium]|nr:bifunctional precorrin-2 dehydrogenase/sirohydrochlorin ferrochelatase [Polyangia bacterium]